MIKQHGLGAEVVKTGEGYTLEVKAMRCDMLEFAEAGRLQAGQTGLGEWERLCSLYRGPLLEGKDYIWKAAMDERYTQLYTSMTKALVHDGMERELWDQAEERLKTYLTLYPLQEDRNRLLLKLYRLAGQPDKASEHRTLFMARYYEELGLEPEMSEA